MSDRVDPGHAADAAPVVVLGVVQAAPGHPATVAVRVRNTATAPRVLLVGPVGLDPAWDARPVRSPRLEPDEEATVELTVTPQLGTPPGRYPFVVTAQPLGAGRPAGEPQQADALLEVGDTNRLTLQVRPDEPDAVHTRRVSIELDNRGAEPVTLELAATARPGLDVRIRRRTVDVPAASTVRVRARMTVQRGRMFGDPRRYPFSVSAQGHAAPLRCDGVFVARPFFSHTLARVMAFVVVIALWAGAAAVGLSKISNSTHQQTAKAQAAAGEGGSGSGGSGGSGSGGSGSGSGSGSGGSGPGGKTAPAPSARLTGTVTGASPGGVTVTVEPTSLVDEAAEGASFVGVPKPAGPVGKLSASLISYEAASVVSAKRSTTTQADGAWAFAGLRAPGYYLLTFAKPGFQTVRYVVSAVAGADPVPLAVPLQAGSGHLSGKVTGPGGPLGGADITITDGTVTVTTSTATTGDVGAWSVDGLSTPDTYLVSASRNGFGLESEMVTLAAGGTQAVDLTLLPGVEALTGSVTGPDDTGHVGGIGGATVTATNGTVTRTATTVTTGPVGSYTLPDLPVPSTYTVTIAAPGYAAQTQQVTLDGKGATHAVDAFMGPSTGTVTGTVTGADGAGLVGAGLVLTGSDQSYKTMSVSNPAGSFRFTGVAPGDYVLSGELFAHVTEYAKVHVDVGKPTTVDLTLQDAPGGGLPATAHIRGKVVDARTGGLVTCPKSTPAGDCVITVSTVDRRATGDKAFSVTVAPGLPYVLPPVDASNEGLLPGLHLVKLSAPGYESTTVPVQVTTGAVVDAPQVALSPAGSIEGSITTRVGTFASGKPACVVVVPSTGGAPGAAPPCTPDTSTEKCTTTAANAKCVVVAADGSYAVGDLDHGTYDVYVIPTDPQYLAPSAGQLTLAVGDTKRYDAVLDRLGVLNVSVFEPNGSATPISVLPATGDVTLTGPNSHPADAVDATTKVTTFTRLQGTYAVDVSFTDPSDSTTYAGHVSGIPVGLNQTVPVSIVLNASTAQQIFVGRVVTLVDGQPKPVAGAVVTVSGVTEFSGLTPVTTTADPVTTGSDGCFAITPDGTAPATRPAGCTGTDPIPTSALGLIGSQAQVAVAAGTGYRALPTTNVTFTPNVLLDIAVPVKGVEVSGQLQPTDADFGGAAVDVIARAPGAGPVSIAVTDKGVLQWNDPTLDPGEAYPGTYKLRVSVPGFDDLTATVQVPDTGPYSFTLTLEAHGGLKVTVGSTDDKNHPLGAVAVVLAGTSTTPVSVTTAPGDPTVTFPDLSPSAGPYTLTLRAAGFQSKTVSGIAVAAGATTVIACGSDETATSCTADTSPPPNATVDLTPGSTLSGNVVGNPGYGSATAPLAGATVTATCTTCAKSYTFTTTTDKAGDYLITGTLSVPALPAGKWTVTATAAGYHQVSGSATATVVLADATSAATVCTSGSVAGGDCVPLSLTADSVDLDITVLSDLNTALSGATVTLTNPSVPGSPFTGTPNPTGTNGVAKFAALPPTQYSVTITAKNYAPLSTVVTLPIGGGTQNISLVISARPNIITGAITGQKGSAAPEPLTGATVTLTDSAGDPVDASHLTQKDNTYQFDSLDDDTYTLTITDTGYGDFTRSITVAKGQVVTVDANLVANSFQAKVAVTSTSGQQVPAGTTVTLTSDDGSVPTQSAVTDDTAQAVFNQVPWGKYSLRSAATAGHQPGTGSLDIPDTTTAGTALTGTVTIAEYAVTVTATSGVTPAPTATLTVKSASSVVASTSLAADGVDARTLFLAPGDYTVSAAASGYTASVSPSTMSLAAPGSTATTASLLVTLTPAQTASVSVVASKSGSPLAGATVTLKDSNNKVVGSSKTTDSAGVASYSGLAADTYTLSVTDGTTTRTSTVTLAGGDAVTLPIDLTPLPSTTAALTVVVTQSGTGLNGATVTLSDGASATTANDGTTDGVASFAGLTPGTYTVKVTDGASVVNNVPITLQGGDAATLRIDLPAAPAPTYTVTVSVTEGGKPALGARVSLLAGATVIQTVTADATGKAQFLGVASGTYTVTATGSRSTLTASANVTVNTSDVVVPVIEVAGSLTVTVQDKSNKPVTDAVVTCTGTDSPDPAPVDPTSGAVEFPDLGAGTYTCTATSGTVSGTATGSSTKVDAGQSATVTLKFP